MKLQVDGDDCAALGQHSLMFVPKGSSGRRETRSCHMARWFRKCLPQVSVCFVLSNIISSKQANI
jgi:hypothetical protein